MEVDADRLFLYDSAFDKTITKLWDAHNKGVCLAHLGFGKQSGIANHTSRDNGRTSDISMLKMMVRSVAYRGNQGEAIGL